MAQAILDLTWDTGLKIRAMLLTDGTLEFNYRDGRSSDVGAISQCWEVDPNGYGSDSARPWHSSRMQVTRAVFDSDFANAGMTNFAYFFHSMQSLVEVVGFQHLDGATDVSHMFTSCNRLETIWATSFDNTTIGTATYPLNGCRRLLGQAGYVAPDSAGKAALSFGASGVLTNPSQDQCTWAYGHLYDTGALEITAGATPDAGRTVLASGRLCANAHYLKACAMPWYDQRSQLRTCAFLADVATVPSWNLDYWFYGMGTLTAVTGWLTCAGWHRSSRRSMGARSSRRWTSLGWTRRRCWTTRTRSRGARTW